MKRAILLFLGVFMTSSLSFAQIGATVEKSIFGVQTGVFGLWVQHDLQLSNQIALRSEIGLDALIWGYANSIQPFWWSFQPVFTLEPRWYHNIAKRSSKGKRTHNNSANFKGFRVSYRPDLFVLSNIEGARIIPDLFIAPTYGIRRSFLNNFNFETVLAIGWLTTYLNDFNGSDNRSELEAQLSLRLGYTF